MVFNVTNLLSTSRCFLVCFCRKPVLPSTAVSVYTVWCSNMYVISSWSSLSLACISAFWMALVRKGSIFFWSLASRAREFRFPYLDYCVSFYLDQIFPKLRAVDGEAGDDTRHAVVRDPGAGADGGASSVRREQEVSAVQQLPYRVMHAIVQYRVHPVRINTHLEKMWYDCAVAFFCPPPHPPAHARCPPIPPVVIEVS